MVLVFILCTIVILLTLIVCIIILSNLRIELLHFEVSNMEQNKSEIVQNSNLNFKVDGKKNSEDDSKILKDYELKFSLYLFRKLKWISVCFNSERLKKVYKKIKWQSIDFKKMEQDLKLEDFNIVKKLQPELSYLYLESKIGVEDAIATSFFAAMISIMISTLLPHIVKKYEKNKYHYKIVPLYINKNVYEIKFDCIIEIKMVHIINILYYFLKKRRGESHEQRASNRRSYGYSHE